MNKESKMNEDYVAGFMAKAAELGVDPEALAKRAGFFKGIGQGFMAPYSLGAGNPIYSDAAPSDSRVKRLLRLLGAGIGTAASAPVSPVLAIAGLARSQNRQVGK